MRYNKKYIWYSYLITSPICLLFLIVDSNLILNENIIKISNRSLWLIISFIIVLIIYTSLSVLLFYCKWRGTIYNFDKNITITSGIIHKKTKVIEFDDIQQMNIDKGIFLKLFGLSRASIGRFIEEENKIIEIIVIDDEKIIEEIVKEIKDKEKIIKDQRMYNKVNAKIKRMDRTIKDNSLEYNFSLNNHMKNEFIMNSFGFHLVLLILFIVFFFSCFIVLFNIGFNLGSLFSFIFTYLISVLLLYTIYRIIFSFIYYNYEVVIDEEIITIKYGYYKNKVIQIEKQDIKSIMIKQNIIQKHNHYTSIVLNIRKEYDNNIFYYSQIFIPFTTLEDCEKQIKMIKSNINYHKLDCISRKNSLKYEMILPGFFGFSLLVCIMIGLLKDFKNIWIIVFCFYLMYNACLLIVLKNKKSNQGFYYDDNYLYISTGIISKKYYIIKYNDINGIGTKTNIFKLKKGIVDAIIFYTFNKCITLSMIDNKIYGELLIQVNKERINN